MPQRHPCRLRLAALAPPVPFGGTLLLYGSICRDCRTSLRIRIRVTARSPRVTWCHRTDMCRWPGRLRGDQKVTAARLPRQRNVSKNMFACHDG